jgi:hypothetical protein
MSLNRSYFLLFAAGFSVSILLKQSIVLITDRKKQWVNLVLYNSFMLYVLIQLVNAWSTLEKRTIPNFTYAISFSTLLYSISLCATLYISMQRVSCFYPVGKFQAFVSKGMIVIPAVLFAVRIVRTVLVFIQNSGSSVFPQAAVMQLITLLPVLALRAVFDCLSLYALRQIGNKSASYFQIEDNAPTKRAMNSITISLIIELFLSIVSLMVATLEAVNYQGMMVSFIDWLLIAWCISSAIDQKAHYRIIFRLESSVGGNTTYQEKPSAV